ncbi:MAG: hypothetical protein KA004_02215 [Verrucomicrobiales bacterium]|nr:hypothetical protein [Verrucomicrobiales bacterium]
MLSSIPCPGCSAETVPLEETHCAACGCEVSILGRILAASADSVLLAMLALRERRVDDALDFAYEAWGLKHTHQSAAVGLLAAVAVGDSVEISRWLRRRRQMDEVTGR